MARLPKISSGAGALLIVVPIALIMAWGGPSLAPSRAELANALSRDGADAAAVTPADIRDILCSDAGAAGGHDCRWRQRVAGRWRAQAGRLVTDMQGWRLAERSQ